MTCRSKVTTLSSGSQLLPCRKCYNGGVFFPRERRWLCQWDGGYILSRGSRSHGRKEVRKKGTASVVGV